MIGTSLGQQFDDKMNMHLGIDNNVREPDETQDDNEVTPNKMMQDKVNASDPHNVYDDQGNMVDYRDPMLSDESNSMLHDMTRPFVPQQTPPD